jgi:hypothetical protein
MLIALGAPAQNEKGSPTYVASLSIRDLDGCGRRFCTDYARPIKSGEIAAPK